MSSRVSPAARNSNASSPPPEAGPEVNVQMRSEPFGSFAAKADVVPLLTDRASIDFSIALLLAVSAAGTAPAKLPPEIATDSTVTAMVSFRSVSVTVTVPVSLMELSVSVRPDVSSPLVMTGVSFVPVIVTERS